MLAAKLGFSMLLKQSTLLDLGVFVQLWGVLLKPMALLSCHSDSAKQQEHTSPEQKKRFLDVNLNLSSKTLLVFRS